MVLQRANTENCITLKLPYFFLWVKKAMLGELYKPSGLAYETAKAVLETEDVYACNVAYGCSNACAYCYVPRFTHRRRHDCEKVRLPQKQPVELVRHQLDKQYRFHWTSQMGVFLSFLTDPFLPECRVSTEAVIDVLMSRGVKEVATLSKLALASSHQVRQGMTVVSLDDAFWRQFEPNTTPLYRRVSVLNLAKQLGDYVWVSMEPYPPSAIYKQDLNGLLEKLKFVDLIVFGKWNYSKLASTEEARLEYAGNIEVLTDFCKSNAIRLHIKSDTVNFVKKTANST